MLALTVESQGWKWLCIQSALNSASGWTSGTDAHMLHSSYDLHLFLSLLWSKGRSKPANLKKRNRQQKKGQPDCSFSESHRPRNQWGRKLAKYRIYGFTFPLAVKLSSLMKFSSLKLEIGTLELWLLPPFSMTHLLIWKNSIQRWHKS